MKYLYTDSIKLLGTMFICFFLLVNEFQGSKISFPSGSSGD